MPDPIEIETDHKRPLRRYAWSCGTLHSSIGDPNIHFGHPGGLVEAEDEADAYRLVQDFLTGCVNSENLAVMHFNVWPVDVTMPDRGPITLVAPDQGQQWIDPSHDPKIPPLQN